jgi:hypothetical protein
MTHITRLVVPTRPHAGLPSLSERLIVLALDADRAGLSVASEHLLHLASEVLDHPDHLRT